MERRYLPVGTKIRFRSDSYNKEDSLPKEWEGTVGIITRVCPGRPMCYRVLREGAPSSDGVYYQEVVPLEIISKRLQTKAKRFLNIKPVWENIS